jgi:hypothetical protein
MLLQDPGLPTLFYVPGTEYTNYTPTHAPMPVAQDSDQHIRRINHKLACKTGDETHGMIYTQVPPYEERIMGSILYDAQVHGQAVVVRMPCMTEDEHMLPRIGKTQGKWIRTEFIPETRAVLQQLGAADVQFHTLYTFNFEWARYLESNEAE